MCVRVSNCDEVLAIVVVASAAIELCPKTCFFETTNRCDDRPPARILAKTITNTLVQPRTGQICTSTHMGCTRRVPPPMREGAAVAGRKRATRHTFVVGAPALGHLEPHDRERQQCHQRRRRNVVLRVSVSPSALQGLMSDRRRQGDEGTPPNRSPSTHNSRRPSCQRTPMCEESARNGDRNGNI